MLNTTPTYTFRTEAIKLSSPSTCAEPCRSKAEAWSASSMPLLYVMGGVMQVT